MVKSEATGDATYKTIGQVAKELDLIDKKTGNLQTHTLRFWEKEFKQIKPRIMSGKRRYYSKKDLEIIKLVKFLLKEKGLTIKGVKNILNNPESQSLDEDISLGIYRRDLGTTKTIKDKIKKIYKIIKELKDLK